jgi:hypothetical protein
MRPSTSTLFLAAIGMLLLAMPYASAATLAIDFTDVTVDYNNGQSWSLGWEFNTVAPFTVTALGFYDDGQNGLLGSHDVGIYDSAGNLIVSATVQPSDLLTNWWRFAPIAPTLLPVADGYRIAATTGSENYTWNPTGFVVDLNLSFVADRYTSSSSLVFPTDTSGDGTIGWFGPNFMFEAAPIPEPSTFGLLGAGLLGLIALRRRSS